MWAHITHICTYAWYMHHNTNTSILLTFPVPFTLSTPSIHLFVCICQLLDVCNNYFYWNTIFVTCSIKWPCMCAETLWWGIPLHKSDRFVTDTILQFTTLHNSRLVGFPQIASTCRNHALVRVPNVFGTFSITFASFRNAQLHPLISHDNCCDNWFFFGDGVSWPVWVAWMLLVQNNN